MQKTSYNVIKEDDVLIVVEQFLNQKGTVIGSGRSVSLLEDEHPEKYKEVNDLYLEMRFGFEYIPEKKIQKILSEAFEMLYVPEEIPKEHKEKFERVLGILEDIKSSETQDGEVKPFSKISEDERTMVYDVLHRCNDIRFLQNVQRQVLAKINTLVEAEEKVNLIRKKYVEGEYTEQIKSPQA